ncbi:MAG TPA: V-type ATP synthase subunit D [Pirellulaceae bacterium]|nr:V-type ATP synthase subunit D [Planctomycetaceae bacterium]HRX81622.1 V-type ATP synthase subunit D [Pirellulaceae bacterium]
MALALNKSSLKQRRDQLSLFQRFLPSLDLKRQQLIADLQRSRRLLSESEQEIKALLDSQRGLFSLLGASEQDLSDLVSIEERTVKEENVLGVRLPVVGEVRFRVKEYSMLAKPFWVDFLVEMLQTMATLKLRHDIEQVRVTRLNGAVRRITQRVNLFDKVLIPQAEKDIHRIKIHLADTERAAVVRAKLAKTKQNPKAATPRTV